LKQRSNPLSWIEVEDAKLSVDEFPDGSFRFVVHYEGTYSTSVGPTFFVTLKSTLPEAIVAAYQVCGALVMNYPKCFIDLSVQTMPDQRADRIEMPGMTNAAMISAVLLGNIPAHRLRVYDLHSDVARTVLENTCKEDQKELEIYEPLDCFTIALDDDNIDPDIRIQHVVAVDKGARHRAETIAKHFGAQVIYADKKRVDGKVVGHVLDGTPDRPIYAGDQIWIVDDLCDGGATFISIAKLLRNCFTFGDLNLYVTHGLFSKGKEELFQHYTTVLALFDYSN
jgi:phosphoribosylpyrophosphate synthetase